MFNILSKFFIFSLIIGSFVSIFPQHVFAKQKKEVVVSVVEKIDKKIKNLEEEEEKIHRAVRQDVDREDFRKGFFLETGDNFFRIDVPEHAIQKRNKAQVRLKPVNVDTLSLPFDARLSDLYSFDIYHKNPILITKPISISLAVTSSTNEEYVMKFWDGITQQWYDVPSAFDSSTHRVNGFMTLSYAIVGIFETPRHTWEGIASWYDWHGAAMNVLPLGTEIEVTNPATGLSARTTIVSTGPFVPNRIIDLPRNIFAEIGNLSSGIMNVIVRTITLR